MGLPTAKAHLLIDDFLRCRAGCSTHIALPADFGINTRRYLCFGSSARIDVGKDARWYRTMHEVTKFSRDAVATPTYFQVKLAVKTR